MIFNVGAGGGASNAQSVKYDNSVSGLASNNVQGAVDELNESLGGVSQFIVDETTGQITGYKTKVGADTVFPFSGMLKSGSRLALKTASVSNNSNHTVSASISNGLSYKQLFCVGGNAIPYINGADATVSGADVVFKNVFNYDGLSVGFMVVNPTSNNVTFKKSGTSSQNATSQNACAIYAVE